VYEVLFGKPREIANDLDLLGSLLLSKLSFDKLTTIFIIIVVISRIPVGCCLAEAVFRELYHC
jgi:hypothetical protein